MSELAFERRLGLPVPELESNERHLRRLAKRPQWKLHTRECAECKQELKSCYAPGDGAVLCEKHFNEATS